MSKNQLNSKIYSNLIFSPLVAKAKPTRKIAYIATMVALSIVCNMYFEFKLGAVQYSFTTAVSALIGIMIGPVAGFLTCFLGDAIGFLTNPFGAYTPWIGLATGLVAFIAGLITHSFKSEKPFVLYVKLAVISLLTFAICSVGINNTFLWIVYYNQMSYFEYFTYRYFVMGQLIVSVVNYALLFILIPVIKRVPYFKDLNI